MRANWLCGRFCVQASSFENYIAEKAFTDRFVQQSLHELKLPHPASSVADIVTISIGTASIKPNEKDDLNQFIRTADNALYSAKAHGRNQYCIGAELMASI